MTLEKNAAPAQGDHDADSTTVLTAPALVRRQLGRRLRRLREAAGITHGRIEELRIASRAKMHRIETGKVPIKTGDILALCRLYNTNDEADALIAMADAQNRPGLWEDYEVPEWFKLYVSLEAVASTIHTFEDSVVPGELQTADYARAVYRAAQPYAGADQPDASDAAIDSYVRLRLDRQESLFGRDPAPRLTVILGEGVLRRPVGGAEVQAGQLDHLRNLDERSSIEIRYLPFAVGAHAAMTGAFRILDFLDDEDPDVVYLETQVGARYLEKPAELAEYRRLFELIHKAAVPIGEYAP